MSNFKLNLPIDIPWKRKCVSLDMMDEKLCDGKSPKRWRSSIAVFEYEPDEENQNYEGMTISYLKVSCSITGYQEDPTEIGLDYRGIRGMKSYWRSQPGIVDYLNTLQKYYPCYGAVLEVKVGPEDERNTPVESFPYFLDFEPKKRELYELVSTTGETMSRSLNSVEIGKSNTSVVSHEVVDIDKGFSIAAEVKVAKTGVGGSYSRQGEWGSRDVSQNESQNIRNTDTSQEMREVQSHTTQLSQMYHQLDSYHTGTNRAVFFIHPRPHTIETEHTFVNGPRNIEGIQDFLFVVARPNNVEKICVEAYLETGHIGKNPYITVEEVPASEMITNWVDAFHAEPKGNDDETPVIDDKDRIWEVKNSFPDYIIKKVEFSLGRPDVDINEQGGPNLIEVPPHIADWNKDFIRVSGRVRSWFEDVDWGKNNIGKITYPFTVKITLVKMLPIEKSDDTLFITGRRLCCCGLNYVRPEEMSGGIVYERPLKIDGIQHLHERDQRTQSIKSVNQIMAGIKDGILNSRNDIASRYEKAIHLPQTNFAIQTLLNRVGPSEDIKWDELKEVPESIRTKLSDLNPEVRLSEILAMPFQMQKDIFSLSDEEVIELRNSLVGLNYQPANLREVWLSEREINRFFRKSDKEPTVSKRGQKRKGEGPTKGKSSD